MLFVNISAKSGFSIIIQHHKPVHNNIAYTVQINLVKHFHADAEEDGDDPQEQEENNPFGLMQAISPGVAKYLFLAHLPLEDQKKCAARAFARAKRDAEILAAGAGTPLQRLRSLRVPAFMEEGPTRCTTRTSPPPPPSSAKRTAAGRTTKSGARTGGRLDFEIKVVATFDVGDEEKH